MIRLTLDPTTQQLLAALDSGRWDAAKLAVAADAADDGGNPALADRLRAIQSAGLRPKRVVQEGKACWAWARAVWVDAAKNQVPRHLFAAVAAEADQRGEAQALFRRRSAAVIALARVWRPPTDAERVNLYQGEGELLRILRADRSVVGVESDDLDQVTLGPGDTLYEDHGEFVPVAWVTRRELSEAESTVRWLLAWSA